MFIEAGKKKVFVGAVDWPGWCRSGRDEASAMEALLRYAPRYALVLGDAGLEFDKPTGMADFHVEEMVMGNVSTDFGAPAVVLHSDGEPTDQLELERWKVILQACWTSFDRAVDSAAGRVLSKGPRGGGRELDEIIDHVLQADQAYLKRLAWRNKPDERLSIAQTMVWTRQVSMQALDAAVEGKLPTVGPRGGAIWTPRYFVRRVAWHVLDHAWEIEDRV